jgi:hypothetical protein
VPLDLGLAPAERRQHGKGEQLARLQVEAGACVMIAEAVRRQQTLDVHLVVRRRGVHRVDRISSDDDEQVRQAVEDLFAELTATEPAMGVVKAFAATGRLFPQRKWGGAWDGQIK